VRTSPRRHALHLTGTHRPGRRATLRTRPCQGGAALTALTAGPVRRIFRPTGDMWRAPTR